MLIGISIGLLLWSIAALAAVLNTKRGRQIDATKLLTLLAGLGLMFGSIGYLISVLTHGR